MPRIPAQLLENVFYLYDSVESARAGKSAGGSGFFVGLNSTTAPNRSYIYAVTNWHVAVRDGFSVVRVNTREGPPDIFDLGPENWSFDPKKGYDIAVVNLPIKSEMHRYKFNDAENGFFTEQTFRENAVGPGDDVFMIGRFVDHDGGPTNTPAARFGHISINPAPIESAHKVEVPAICLDMNSRSGYSGSPVFMYRTLATDLEELNRIDITEQKFLIVARPMLMLLGIHCGQWAEWLPISRRKDESEAQFLERTGDQVRGLSGMTYCEPAWHIREILDLPHLVQSRALTEADLLKEPQTPQPEAPTPEVAITSPGTTGS